jgi:predicted permease
MILIAVAALTAVTEFAWLYGRRAFPSAAERGAFTLTVLWSHTGALGVRVTLAVLGSDFVLAAARPTA